MSILDVGQSPEPDRTEQNGRTEWTRDYVFHILSNNRRRYVLHSLLQGDGSASKRELSRQLAAWENDIPIEEVTPDMRKPMYIALHQTHLPKMADAGLVRMDRGDVRLTENAEDLQVFVNALEGADPPWNKIYLGIGAVSCVIVTSGLLGLPPYTFVPSLLWVALIVGALVATSLLHTVVDRRSELGSDGPPPKLNGR